MHKEMACLEDISKHGCVLLDDVTEAVGGVAGGDEIKCIVRQPVTVHRVRPVQVQQTAGQTLTGAIDKLLTLQQKKHLSSFIPLHLFTI